VRVTDLKEGTVFYWVGGATPYKLAIKGPGDWWGWLYGGRFNFALAYKERLDEEIAVPYGGTYKPDQIKIGP
jgi:hypothetical protein